MKYSPIAAALSLVFGLIVSGSAFADGYDKGKGGKNGGPELEIEESFNDDSKDDNDVFDADKSFNDKSEDDNDYIDLDDTANDKSNDDNDVVDLDGSLNDQSQDDNDVIDVNDTANDKSQDDNDVIDLDDSFNDRSHDTNFDNNYSVNDYSDTATVHGKGVASTYGDVHVDDSFNEAWVGSYGAAAGDDVDMEDSFNNASVAGFGAAAGDDVDIHDSFNLENSANTVNAGDDAAVINGDGDLEAYFGDTMVQTNELNGEIHDVSFNYHYDDESTAVSQNIHLGDNVLRNAGGAINNNQTSGNANIVSQGININAGGFGHGYSK